MSVTSLRFPVVVALGALAAGAAVAAPAPLPADPISSVQLPGKLPPHWLWVNDVAFVHLPDSRAYLVDADQGQMRGMLSTGVIYISVLPSRDGSVIYSPETYFSRGVRGTRTDVVTIYDAAHLAPIGEIAIPPKRVSAIPMPAQTVLTDDDRFVLIYNFTPSQSISAVDTKSRKFVGEIDTAGCALAFPTGPRSFFSICGDGGLLSVKLDEEGKASAKSHSKPLFDPQKDPPKEKGVRLGDTWYFVSYDGDVYPITDAAKGPALATRWSLVTEAERAAGWRSGGLQELALHRATKRLYAIMHQGPRATHKDPGKEVWVFDLATRTRVQKITMKNIVTSIAVSQDEQPLLYGVFMGSSTLDIYNATTGEYLRSVSDLASTPTLLVTP
jgi:methylamine dehydrogenase heavy chain